jgi:hypothetical protein
VDENEEGMCKGGRAGLADNAAEEAGTGRLAGVVDET